MRTNMVNKMGSKLAIATAFGVLLTAGAAQAGRGGSPQAIQMAITSGSPDAIKAELERSEFLVCGSCVDLVTPLIDNADGSIRQVAAWWLARRAASRQVRVDMLNRLSQPDSIAARNAADVLGEFHYVSSIPALSAALSNPIYSGEARAAMARALGNINRPAVVAPLTAALADGNAQVKTGALLALQRIAGLRDGTAIVPLVSDADAGVRAEAVNTLGTFRAQEGTSALVTALQTDSSATVRKLAAWALGETHASAGVAGQALQTAAASDPSPFVRSLAAAALTKLSQ
jgi:HEAT repeat protein